jgi:hypothetical protein
MNQDGISVEYFFQLGGLAQAEFERTGEWVDDLFVANFSKEGGEPRVIFASEFGMSPQAYAGCTAIKDWAIGEKYIGSLQNRIAMIFRALQHQGLGTHYTLEWIGIFYVVNIIRKTIGEKSRCGYN